MKLNFQYSVHLMWKINSLEKTLMLAKIEGRRKRGATEDEIVGWHHWPKGHEFEQTQGDSNNRETRYAVVHEVTRSWPWLSHWTAAKVENKIYTMSEKPAVFKLEKSKPPSATGELLRAYVFQAIQSICDLTESRLLSHFHVKKKQSSLPSPSIV